MSIAHKTRCSLIAAAALLALSAPLQGGRLVQVGAIDALMAGVLDGSHPIDTVQRENAIGIGTFDRLDGEMVILDGVVYRIGGDGSISKPSPDTLTPFAAMVAFAPETNVKLGEVKDFAAFQAICGEHLGSVNHMHAIRISGTFRHVHTRSVPAQKKPYPTLSEITANQNEFHLRDVKGTLVGFYTPKYLSGLQVPGYHLHFITSDLTAGGHVLNFEMEEGHLALEAITSLQIILPDEDSAFAESDLSGQKLEHSHVFGAGTAE